MVWGVVYDFMSFCTVLYGKNFEESEMSIAESRFQLSAEISEYTPMDFHFKKLIHVFLSIAKCSNGILANAFIPKMVNNPDEDSENENDMNDRNDSDDSDDDEDADDDPTSSILVLDGVRWLPRRIPSNRVERCPEDPLSED